MQTASPTNPTFQPSTMKSDDPNFVSSSGLARPNHGQPHASTPPMQSPSTLPAYTEQHETHAYQLHLAITYSTCYTAKTHTAYVEHAPTPRFYPLLPYYTALPYSILTGFIPLKVFPN